MTLSFNIWSSQLQATEVNVSSVAALQNAINSASSGDVLILANGTYLNNTLTISKNNITVKAATLGSVYLNGTNDITISGNYVTFSGFQFTSGSITGIVISVNGSHNIVTQLNFNGYSAQKYILLNAPSQYNEISYCNFESKPTSAPKGNLIHIDPDATLPGYHKIRYCSFQNMLGAGGDNGNECIRISNGATSTYVSRTIVEYCYFTNTGLGDSEVISVKCQENVLRFNTNTNNQQGNFCFRNGNNNIAYGNFFINAGGIRVKEANNIYCYNNYFENCGDGTITAPVKYVYLSPNLNNINFIHNTFIDGTSIELDNGATSNTWANNIFKKSSSNIFTGSVSGISWAGNIRSGNLGVTISSGMSTNTDPLLVANSESYQSIASSSPAINVASASYPAILDIANVDDDPTLSFDISGQSRPATVTLKDVGCDEYTTGSTTNHPLTLSNVGPTYLGGPIPLPVELQSFSAKINRSNVELVWSTAMEVNNAGFEIERAVVSGQSSAKAWSKIGYVEGAGTSNAPKNYSFVDASAKGSVSYRLKEIDRDAKFEYSNSVEAVVALTAEDFKLSQNFPNPFNPNTIISFAMKNGEHVNVTVYNSLGQVVATLFNSIANPNELYSLNFDGKNLSSGTYFYSLRSASRNEVKKMTLLK